MSAISARCGPAGIATPRTSDGWARPEMARDSEAQAPQQSDAAELDPAVWLEAYGLLHNDSDGCDHCDNWTARYWSTGHFTACTDSRCVGARGASC
jgi:hypothetical protein